MPKAVLTEAQAIARCKRCASRLDWCCYERCVPPNIERHGPGWIRRIRNCPRGKVAPSIEELIAPMILTVLNEEWSESDA